MLELRQISYDECVHGSDAGHYFGIFSVLKQ